MAKMQFWGNLEGRGQTVERGGTKISGLETEAAGWEGRIRVRVFYNERKGRDEFEVHLMPHWNEVGVAREIASGILDYDIFPDAYIPALIA